MGTQPAMEKIALPEGWEVQPEGSSLTLVTPDKCAVYVDFERRWWNLGYNYSRLNIGGSRCTSEGIKYAGRGWQEKLVADAVVALQAIGG